MRILAIMFVFLLAGCGSGRPFIVTVTPAPVIVTATPESTATRIPLTRIPSLDCETNATRDGFYPINNNPCLRGGEMMDVNPPGINNSERDRMQWVPAGLQPYWQRGTVVDPYVFRVDGGGFRVDIDYQDGGYGVSWFQEFNPGACYVLKLTVRYNIQPRQNSPLDRIQFTGRMISLSNGITRVFTPQSPDRASGVQEFIWTIIAPSAAHIDLYQFIHWASYDGEIDWQMIEMLEPPAGTNYCGVGSVVF